jgi:hypothetical protein
MPEARTRVFLLLAAGILLAAVLTSAQEPSEATTPSGSWVLGSSLGTGAANGGYGEFLETPWNFDVNISKGRGAWRFGGGLQFGSMAMKPPYEEEKEWARLETSLLARRVFRHEAKLRPYLEARLGLQRIHPRSELFYFEEEPELPTGDSLTESTLGVGLTLQPGFELELTKGFALDVSGWWTAYQTGDYSLIPPLHGPVDPPLSDSDTVNAGQEYGVRVGLLWRPRAQGTPPLPEPARDPETGQLAPLPPPAGDRDAWGVPRSWGWAAGETLAINFGASMINEYVRNANFNQISPRSFHHNFEHGWTYDDNAFKTNQLIHPWNGSAYFNAARSNGLGFWGSSLFSLAGAFIWECCGETHPASWNDMVSTGIGGVARGEWAYRISSLILDNTKSGKGRAGQEVAAFLFNPVRGFNRVVSGRAGRVQGNPADPYDWRPPDVGIQVSAGARVIGEGESISENTKYYGFLEGSLQFGSPFFNERRRPFDRFDTRLQLNFGDKTAVGALIIRGDLASWVLGDKENPRHVLSIIQDFDYIDNEAYEYGGQSFGVSLFSGFGDHAGSRLVTRLTAYGTASAAVNSDYSFLAEVGDRERFREYDYGPGLGGGAEALWIRRGRPLVSLSYRYTWIDVRNGSVWNPDDDEAGEGSDATHQVHRFWLRAIVPRGQTLGIGADATFFYRDSEYTAAFLEDHTQYNPEVRVYLSWDLGWTRGSAANAD